MPGQNSNSSNLQASSEGQYWRWALSIIAAITLLRLIILFASPLNLGGDEAQYWDWSRTFAFGYFSKPPLIAWLIGLTTSACGHGEACVRLSSPLLHMGTALILFRLARRMFDDKTALWTGITFCLLPGISFSSGIITTDVPLLFFWSLSLLLLHKALDKDDMSLDVILGVCIGFGFLAKYAMIYFLIGMVLVILFSKSARTFVHTQKALIVLGIISLFLLPNIIWNLQNDLSTLSHTAANANWENSRFQMEGLLNFVADQFALFGPFLFLTLIILVGMIIQRLIKTRGLREHELYLLSFILPALLVVIFQSFVSRAHGNWAAVAYPAATILVVHTLRTGWQRYVLYGSTALHAVFALGFYTLSLNLNLIDQTGLSNAFKRVRGWPELTSQITEASKSQALYTLLFDDRMLLTEYLYYGRKEKTTAFVWDYNRHPENHYEFTRPLIEPTRDPILLVTRNENPTPILDAFDQTEFLTKVEISQGRNKTLTVYLYILHGFEGR